MLLPFNFLVCGCKEYFFRVFNNNNNFFRVLFVASLRTPPVKSGTAPSPPPTTVGPWDSSSCTTSQVRSPSAACTTGQTSNVKRNCDDNVSNLPVVVLLRRCTQIKTYSWDNAQVILVGNKCDMEDERVISYERGKQLADSIGVEFFEASAKENINVRVSGRVPKTATKRSSLSRKTTAPGCVRAPGGHHLRQDVREPGRGPEQPARRRQQGRQAGGRTPRGIEL